MSLKFFTIPVQDDGTAEQTLNTFLCNHRVLSVDRRWVDQGPSSFWALCVDYLDSSAVQPGTGRAASQRGKVDYKELLNPEDFARFADLREVRKQIAQAEAVPVYTIFTNEQLSQIVQKRVSTKAELEQIEGVGDARVEKYGARILERMGPSPPAAS